MKSNIKWLRDKLKVLNLDGMIVSNPVSIKYLIDVDAEGTLLITPKETAFLTDSRYIEMVNSMLTIDDEIVVFDIRNLSSEEYEAFFEDCTVVGFEEDYVTYSGYKRILQKYKVRSLEETEKIIEKQRQIKDENEIELIKKACQITDDCFTFLKDYIKVGQSERKIAARIDRYFNEFADGKAFDTIVASGPNSAIPHAVPTERRIEEGDIITIDMGCKYKGYASDMTRTIFVKYVKEEYKEVYELVLKNQKQSLTDMRDGNNFKQIVRDVENDFGAHNYILVHALGHGVGLEVHEFPFFSSRVDYTVKENMIVTSEPGIYIEGKFGVRIEDTLQVTKYRGEALTRSDKNYVIVDNNSKDLK